jgi:hypothetical protein
MARKAQGQHTELAHLSDASGVVADGAIVDDEADGEGGEHAEGGHGDTVLGSELEGDADGDGEGENRHDGGLHAEGKTCAYMMRMMHESHKQKRGLGGERGSGP